MQHSLPKHITTEMISKSITNSLGRDRNPRAFNRSYQRPIKKVFNKIGSMNLLWLGGYRPKHVHLFI